MLAIILSLLFTASLLLCLRRRRRTLRRRFRHRLPSYSYDNGRARGSRTPLLKDKFSPDKVPEELDCILVGGGVGSLTTAAALRRCGWRVLVLEQHDVAGGSIHTFDEHGVSFDTGLHYLGDLRHSSAAPWLASLLPSPLRLAPMHSQTYSDGCYDVCSLFESNDCYRFVAGEKELEAELRRRFPAKTEALERYFRLVNRLANSSTLSLFFKLKCIRPRWIGSLLCRLLTVLASDGWAWRRAAADVVAELLIDDANDVEGARAAFVLQTQWGDYGTRSDEAPFYMHAQVVSHYIHGAFFPLHGADQLTSALVEAVEGQRGDDAGCGRVLVEANVTRLLFSDDMKRVVGVEVNGSNRVCAEAVVVGTGYAAFRRLLPPLLQSSLCPLPLSPSGSMVYLFVSLSGTRDELQLPAYNRWSYPYAHDNDAKESHATALNRYLSSPKEHRPPTFISFPSAKDDEWEKTYVNNRSTALVLTMLPYDYFKQWHGSELKHRGDEYEREKQQLSDRLLAELFRFYPHLKDKVHRTTLGTPLTFEHYLNANRGQVYGRLLDSARFTPAAFDVLRPETKVSNLFLTGQDVTTVGITSSLLSGVLTAHTILDYGNLLDIDVYLGRDLNYDLKKKEKEQKKKQN